MDGKVATAAQIWMRLIEPIREHEEVPLSFPANMHNITRVVAQFHVCWAMDQPGINAKLSRS